MVDILLEREIVEKSNVQTASFMWITEMTQSQGPFCQCIYVVDRTPTSNSIKYVSISTLVG